MSGIKLRAAVEADIEALASLYRDTILSVNRAHYDEAQAAAWAGRSRNTDSLRKRMGEQYFLIAEAAGEVVGFGSVTKEGYLDFMYVHKNWQRRGIASLLFDALLGYALQNDAVELRSDVSITARPFFESKGFNVVQAQNVDLDGVILQNFKMQRSL